MSSQSLMKAFKNRIIFHLYSVVLIHLKMRVIGSVNACDANASNEELDAIFVL